MIIEDPETFRTWLTAVLEPRCDADPAALAKYVLALVRKDKPIPELKKCMIEQLDVFLAHETKAFVEQLFRALETQSFPVVPNSSLATAATSAAAPLNQPIDPAATKLPESFPVLPAVVPAASAAAVEPPGAPAAAATNSGPKREEVKRKPDGRAAQRARSRSWERGPRTRSRDYGVRRERVDRMDRVDRAWRNKSPPARSRHNRRSWSRSKSPVGLRSRSKSPRLRGRYRNRSPPMVGSRSRSPRTPDRGAGSSGGGRNEPISGSGTPTQDSNHGDVDMRLTTSSQSIQSVVRAKQTLRCRDFDEKGYCMRGDLCPFDHGTDPVVLEDVALGSVLTFSQPQQVQPALPVHVHQPQGRPMLMQVGPGSGPGPRMRPPMHMPMHPHSHMRGPHSGNMEYNPDAPSMEPRGWGRGFRGAHRGGRGHRPMPYNSHQQRELISVPVMQQYSQAAGFEHHHDRHQPKEPMKQRMGYEVFGRLGPRFKSNQPASLELKKIPRGLNNITHLNEHFSKFGKMVNIQVSLDGDPEAAIVTFSSHAEANAAYRSTEAVLNNRFIKVFWHNPNNEVKQVQENVPPPRPSVKDRLGMVSNNNHSLDNVTDSTQNVDKALPEEKVIMSGNKLTKTLYIPTAKKADGIGPNFGDSASAIIKANSLAAIKNSQDMLEAKVTLKRMQLEKQKEAMKLSANLRKRKQELLEKYLSQQRLLLGRLEKLAPGDERRSLMATIKSLQESIEAIKKQTEGGSVGATKAKLRAKPTPKTKEAAQKEILDLELDLFARQQGGGDTSELKLRVAELKLEAQALLTPGLAQAQGGSLASATRRTSTFRARGRNFAAAGPSSVDHRPTKLLVSGYENDEKPDVLIHFGQYGEITDYMCDDATPSVILNFKSRKGAEAALVKGRNFQDRLLSITWCSQPGHPGHPGHRNSRMVSSLTHHALSTPRGEGHTVSAQRNINRDDDDEEEEEEARMHRGGGDADDDGVSGLGILGDEDILLQDDEEEEDDDEEEKTWRR